MLCDGAGKKDKPIAAYNNIPSANTDSLVIWPFPHTSVSQ